MMRILWLVNIKLPIIFNIQGKRNTVNTGGWLDRISKGLIEKKIELIICYPSSIEEQGKKDNLTYYGFRCDMRKMHKGRLNDQEGIKQAKKVINLYNPDVIHIHGTEFQDSWYFAKAAECLHIERKILVSIQGLVSVYAKHFCLGIPEKICSRRTVKEIINRKNICDDRMYYSKRGAYEEDTIRIAHNIMGRTTWDYACVMRINPDAHYYTGYETLRECFYSGEWNYSSCVKNRIFISQAGYPIKGFHLFLSGLADIKRVFPDVSVQVAGMPLTGTSWVRGNTFSRYIANLIKRYDLQNNIQFCGNLNALQMKEEMLQCNVFVSASTIENSPNSVGEAMLLGVPIVASNVGGVPDMITSDKEGYLYQVDAPYMLAHYVEKVFSSQSNDSMIKSARTRAEKVHNYESNLQALLEVYNKVAVEQ